MSIPNSVSSVPQQQQQWVARLKMEPGTTGQNVSVVNSVNSVVNAINSGATFVTSSGQVNIQNIQGIQSLQNLQNNGVNIQQGGTTTTLSLTSMESYEEVFKEITKKLYGDGDLTEVIDGSGNIQQANIIYETGDSFRTDAGGNMTFVTAPNGALPPGTIVLQRKIHQDKEGRLWASVDMPQSGDQQLALTQQEPSQQQQIQVVHTTTPSAALEERWFESEEVLAWTVSKIARYNPSQKVFRCVDCDFVGFLSRVAEHWLGNHASLRVFQCPRCPYTSAWARCVRMHLQKQHGETLTDNSLWKENPVLEEYKTQVTKFLTGLKTRVEQKGEALALNGERRYTCPFCPYATDRRDLFNRHENIHRDAKPFQCYVCDKQFNRADHVKKHFTRMHRDHPYDINKIKKHFPKGGGVVPYHNSKMAKSSSSSPSAAAGSASSPSATTTTTTTTISATVDASGNVSLTHLNTSSEEQEMNEIVQELEQTEGISLQLADGSTVQQIPHIAYFNPPSTPGQNGPLQGIAGVGGTKKESKSKGVKKKKSGEKMFTCSYCPWQGVDNWCLKRHLNTHIKPFLCALCDYKAARSERLATHVLKVHNKRVCHKCSFLADDTESLSQHIQDSHQNPLVKTGFNCNVCQEYFELRADLEAHAILEHQKVIVQCDLCDFRTTDELSMEAHLREKHNLQPGMGAVAAAAAAAAAAAIGQPTSTQYQMQLPTQTQMLQDPLSMNLDHQNLLLTSEQLNQSISAQDSLQFQQEVDVSQQQQLLQQQQQQQNVADGVQLQNLPIEPELEPETLCEKCGIEFADEASLKLHEKRHEVEVVPKESGKAVNKKPLLRSYTCSTCSYTASTKKIMMQHQRAHNGLELICKAEACLFSTPFDNTLKEHIHSEHGTEPNVRCPHCGLKVPSTNAFTYHWRAHHPNLCSLCVNLYRVKYGIKENDLHELISKSMLDLLNDDLQPKSKPVIQIQDQQMEVDPLTDPSTTTDPSSTADPSTSQQNLDLPTEVKQENIEENPPQTETITHNNNNDEYAEGDEPLAKKPRLEESEQNQEPQGSQNQEPQERLDFSSIISSVNLKNSREALKLIPNFNEVLVIPVISEQFFKTFTKSWQVPTTLIQSSKSHPSVPPPQKSKKSKRKTFRNGKRAKFRNLGLGEMRLLPLRRYIPRGTRTWLRRHCWSGGSVAGKCHEWNCAERSRKYFRRAGVVLHRLWRHSQPTYSCDSCPLRFVHLYQAYLHKLREHKEDPNENVNVKALPPSPPKYQHQQIIITSEENIYQQEQLQLMDQQQQQQIMEGFKTEIH